MKKKHDEYISFLKENINRSEQIILLLERNRTPDFYEIYLSSRFYFDDFFLESMLELVDYSYVKSLEQTATNFTNQRTI